jgi:TonB-linked SusC/RagA family outer membrane protein
MDSYTFAVMLNQAQMNSGSAQYFSNETMQKMLDFQAGKLSGVGLDPSPSNPSGAWEDSWSRGYANTDLYTETYKEQVFSQEHNISVSGGNQGMTFYASMQYLDQGGMLKIAEDGLERYNLTGKMTADITKWLKFGFSTRFTRNNVWRPTSGMQYNYYGRGNWPNIPMYDPFGRVFQDNARPMAYGGTRDMTRDRLYNQGVFTIEPIKNWITKVEINYSTSDEGIKQVTLPAYRNTPEGVLMTGTTNSALYQYNRKENYMNINAYSEYSHTFADAHNFKIMAGFQAEDMRQSTFSVTKNGLIMADLPEFDLTTGLGGNGAAMNPAIGGNSNSWSTAGFFGRLNYDYKGRYLFEANLRYDGSSRFRRGSRWALSPSFSAGWNIAHENFWEPISGTVNLLKLRASYGELGNQNTNSWYPTYRNMGLGALNGNWLTIGGTRPNTANIGSLVSTVLTGANVREWNAGLDWGMLNNRLTGSFDMFTRYTNNMVGPATELPATLGIATPQTNNTDLHTRGWEIALSWRDRLKNGFSYGVNLSVSDQVTIIDSYPSNLTGSIDNYMSGKQDGLIWGFETVGIAKTQAEMDAHLASLPDGGQSAIGSQWSAGDIMYRDINGDGKISTGARTWEDHGDLVILGDNYSHYFFGVDITASWKGFDFRCFLQGVLHRDFWPGGISNDGNEDGGGYFWGVRGNKSMWHIRGFEQHGDYFRDTPIGLPGNEIPANIDSYFPRPLVSPSGTANGKNQRVQSRYMQNARYMRIKNLQVGYTLPSALTGKWGIANCRVFFSGENLFTATPLFSIFDPETAMGGVGGNAYPLSRTLSFGVSLTL